MTSWRQRVRATFRTPAPYVSGGAVAIVLALSGPFGTYTRFAFPERLTYWIVVVSVGMVWGVSIRALIETHRPEWSYWTVGATASILSSVLLAWPVHRFTLFMAGSSAEIVPSAPEIGALIVPIALSISALRWALAGPDVVKAQPVPEIAVSLSAPEPRLLSRLDPALRAPIQRISGSNHHVQVWTDAGMATLLMRFSDAMAETDPEPGMQVHRSHWVARRVVRDCAIRKGRPVLVLDDGAEVPVSRKFENDVTAAGLCRASAP